MYGAAFEPFSAVSPGEPVMEIPTSMDTSLLQNLPPIERDQASYTFAGHVSLSLRVGPWKLLFHLRPISLGARHLQAELSRGDIERDMQKDDITQLFSRSHKYTLQIESPAPHLPSPVVSARLQGWNSSPSGLNLLFTIQETNEDYDILVEELRQNQQASQDWLR